MRGTLVSILLLVGAARCFDLGKDVNYYKDYLRARSDEMPEPAAAERMLSDFYRTPLQLNPGLLPALEQEYKKRTGNVFKNHMLTKDMLVEGAAAKRSSKTALSLMLQGKHPFHTGPDYNSELEEDL